MIIIITSSILDGHACLIVGGSVAGARGRGGSPGTSEIEAIIPVSEVRTDRLKLRSSNGPVETCGVGGRMGGLAFPVVRRLREGSICCSFY